MHKRKTVKFSTKLQLSRGVTRSGHDYEDAPFKAAGMFRVTLEKLLSPDFACTHRHPEDYYFFPGVHKEKTYRYRVNDTDFDHKDDFDFFLVPIDIDIHFGKTRIVWQNKKDPTSVIDALFDISKTARLCHDIASSRGGIRMVYILDKTVNSLEWRSFYKDIVDGLKNDLQGEYGKFGKMSFSIGEFGLVLDGRNPGSLTRVPFGFRAGAPVTEAKYFYHKKVGHIISIDNFGPIQEFEKVRCDVPGYEVVNITNEMSRQNRGVPKGEDLAPLPSGMKPFSWPGGLVPQQGEREIAIFQAVSNAKREFTDRLTPEQYYSYFHEAIVVQIPGEGAKIPLPLQLWAKIIRDWYQRSDAETAAGKKLDVQQQRNSGGMVAFDAKDFDNIRHADKSFEYIQKEQEKITHKLLEMTAGLAFLNSPPGASKSSTAVELLLEHGGIYITRTNKQIKDLLKRLNRAGRKNINLVLSYRSLVSVVCAGDSDLIKILHAKYDNEYTPNYADAQYQCDIFNAGLSYGNMTDLMCRKGRMWFVKSFPEFIKPYYPIQAQALERENKKRKNKLEQGYLSLLTYDKFKRMSNTVLVQALPEDHQLIFDEAEPSDVFSPEKYVEEKTLSIFGKEIESPTLRPDDATQREGFLDYIRTHKTIFINADRGLELALAHSGFKDVTIHGRDMNYLFDDHFHIVYSPDMSAGYTEFKSKKDLRELSPRAIYAGTVNPEMYTLLTNGADAEGVTLSENNLKNAIGSNDFLNSRIIALLTYPTPEQIAEFVFCTGVSVDKAKRLLFQNLINQIISRNVGYRSLSIINEIGRLKGEEPRTDNNEHILILPESARLERLELIVKTVNVWTVKSQKVPKHIEPYISRLDKAIAIRRDLYNIEPGTKSSGPKLVRKHKVKISYLKEILDDDMLADFTIKRRGTLDGKRAVNVIIRHETLQTLLKKCLSKITESKTKISKFYKILIEESSEKFIKNMKASQLKSFIKHESFRYNFRIVTVRSIDYLCRTDEEDIFY